MRKSWSGKKLKEQKHQLGLVVSNTGKNLGVKGSAAISSSITFVLPAQSSVTLFENYFKSFSDSDIASLNNILPCSSHEDCNISDSYYEPTTTHRGIKNDCADRNNRVENFHSHLQYKKMHGTKCEKLEVTYPTPGQTDPSKKLIICYNRNSFKKTASTTNKTENTKDMGIGHKRREKGKFDDYTQDEHYHSWNSENNTNSVDNSPRKLEKSRKVNKTEGTIVDENTKQYKFDDNPDIDENSDKQPWNCKNSFESPEKILGRLERGIQIHEKRTKTQERSKCSDEQPEHQQSQEDFNKADDNTGNSCKSGNNKYSKKPGEFKKVMHYRNPVAANNIYNKYNEIVKKYDKRNQNNYKNEIDTAPKKNESSLIKIVIPTYEKSENCANVYRVENWKKNNNKNKADTKLRSNSICVYNKIENNRTDTFKKNNLQIGCYDHHHQIIGNKTSIQHETKPDFTKNRLPKDTNIPIYTKPANTSNKKQEIPHCEFYNKRNKVYPYGLCFKKYVNDNTSEQFNTTYGETTTQNVDEILKNNENILGNYTLKNLKSFKVADVICSKFVKNDEIKQVDVYNVHLDNNNEKLNENSSRNNTESYTSITDSNPCNKKLNLNEKTLNVNEKKLTVNDNLNENYYKLSVNDNKLKVNDYKMNANDKSNKNDNKLNENDNKLKENDNKLNINNNKLNANDNNNVIDVKLNVNDNNNVIYKEMKVNDNVIDKRMEVNDKLNVNKLILNNKFDTINENENKTINADKLCTHSENNSEKVNKYYVWNAKDCDLSKINDYSLVGVNDNNFFVDSDRLRMVEIAKMNDAKKIDYKYLKMSDVCKKSVDIKSGDNAQMGMKPVRFDQKYYKMSDVNENELVKNRKCVMFNDSKTRGVDNVLKKSSEVKKKCEHTFLKSSDIRKKINELLRENSEDNKLDKIYVNSIKYDVKKNFDTSWMNQDFSGPPERLIGDQSRRYVHNMGSVFNNQKIFGNGKKNDDKINNWFEKNEQFIQNRDSQQNSDKYKNSDCQNGNETPNSCYNIEIPGHFYTKEISNNSTNNEIPDYTHQKEMSYNLERNEIPDFSGRKEMSNNLDRQQIPDQIYNKFDKKEYPSETVGECEKKMVDEIPMKANEDETSTYVSNKFYYFNNKPDKSNIVYDPSVDSHKIESELNAIDSKLDKSVGNPEFFKNLDDYTEFCRKANKFFVVAKMKHNNQFVKKLNYYDFKTINKAKQENNTNESNTQDSSYQRNEYYSNPGTSTSGGTTVRQPNYDVNSELYTTPDLDHQINQHDTNKNDFTSNNIIVYRKSSVHLEKTYEPTEKHTVHPDEDTTNDDTGTFYKKSIKSNIRNVARKSDERCVKFCYEKTRDNNRWVSYDRNEGNSSRFDYIQTNVEDFRRKNEISTNIDRYTKDYGEASSDVNGEDINKNAYSNPGEELNDSCNQPDKEYNGNQNVYNRNNYSKSFENRNNLNYYGRYDRNDGRFNYHESSDYHPSCQEYLKNDYLNKIGDYLKKCDEIRRERQENDEYKRFENDLLNKHQSSNDLKKFSPHNDDYYKKSDFHNSKDVSPTISNDYSTIPNEYQTISSDYPMCNSHPTCNNYPTTSNTHPDSHPTICNGHPSNDYPVMSRGYPTVSNDYPKISNSHSRITSGYSNTSNCCAPASSSYKNAMDQPRKTDDYYQKASDYLTISKEYNKRLTITDDYRQFDTDKAQRSNSHEFYSIPEYSVSNGYDNQLGYDYNQKIDDTEYYKLPEENNKKTDDDRGVGEYNRQSYGAERLGKSDDDNNYSPCDEFYKKPSENECPVGSKKSNSDFYDRWRPPTPGPGLRKYKKHLEAVMSKSFPKILDEAKSNAAGTNSATSFDSNNTYYSNSQSSENCNQRNHNQNYTPNSYNQIRYKRSGSNSNNCNPNCCNRNSYAPNSFNLNSYSSNYNQDVRRPNEVFTKKNEVGYKNCKGTSTSGIGLAGPSKEMIDGSTNDFLHCKFQEKNKRIDHLDDPPYSPPSALKDYYDKIDKLFH